MLFDGTHAQLTLSLPGTGPLLAGPLPLLLNSARLAENSELIRFVYELTDPETGEPVHGAGRLLLEPLPYPVSEPETAPGCKTYRVTHRTEKCVSSYCPRCRNSA
jgi:hypothetical protein